jgi:hypothetical protein
VLVGQQIPMAIILFLILLLLLVEVEGVIYNPLLVLVAVLVAVAVLVSTRLMNGLEEQEHLVKGNQVELVIIKMAITQEEAGGLICLVVKETLKVLVMVEMDCHRP